MSDARNAEAIWQMVQRFVAEQYGCSVTFKEWRGVPESGTLLYGEDAQRRADMQCYSLVFEIEGMGQKLLPVPEGLMEDADFTQERASDYLSRELPRRLGLVAEE